jgi:putative ABC transport system permease protein
LKLGLGSAGRRPLRTSLTTTGVAIGIAALSLIVALAGGLQEALLSPALATSQLHQVGVYPVADAAAQTFDASTLTAFARLPHVSAAWGQVGMTGTFSAAPPPGSSASAASASATQSAPPSGVVVSLPPLKSSSALPVLVGGRLPSSDAATEILLTDSEATALGYRTPMSAIATHVKFTATTGSVLLGPKSNTVTKPVPLDLIVVGVISSHYTPAGAPGGMLPYVLMTSHWAKLAKENGWKSGEFTNITLLADSGLAVEGLRQHVEALGFQSQTFGDQFRNFEDLLGKLRVALLGLALVALLLACLGIANTMYTSVLERTKEIGVLKALGARSRDVLLLFVAEAAVIGLAGGLIGALFAVALARLGNAAVDRLTQELSSSGFDVFRTSVPIMLAAIVVAVVLSTVSGLLPAVRAAAHDPARALRYE